jgi:hypothetical protein
MTKEEAIVGARVRMTSEFKRGVCRGIWGEKANRRYDRETVENYGDVVGVITRSAFAGYPRLKEDIQVEWDLGVNLDEDECSVGRRLHYLDELELAEKS